MTELPSRSAFADCLGNTFRIRASEEKEETVTLIEVKKLGNSGPREQFSVLAVNTRNKPLSHEVVSTGSLNGSLVHPREVFLHAVLQSAAAIVVCHNHPSGDPVPSREDRELTRRLAEAGSVLGISLLDHVILGHGRYWSFKEQGEL